MAEERIDIPGISEIIELKGGHVRRYSTGNVGAPNSGVKILSRYLSASTGSCHDFCKYGLRHAGETKAWRSMMKKTTIRSESPGLEMIQETATSAGTNKKLAIGLKPSPNSKTQRPDNPVVIRREVSSVTKKVTVSSDQVSSPLKEIDVSVKHACDPKLKSVQSKLPSELTPGYLNTTRNSEIRKIKEMGAVSMNSVGVSDSRRKSEIGKSKELRTFERGEKTVLVPPSVAPTAKHSVQRVSSMNAKNSKSLTGNSVLKNQSNDRKTKPEQPSSEDVPPSVSSSVKHSVKRVSRMNAKNSKNLTGNSVSKNQSNARKTKPEQHSIEAVPEKTLDIVELNAENKTGRPIQDVSHSSDLSPSSCSFSEDKCLKHTQSGTRTGRSPPSVQKKNLRRTQNGISATRSLPSLSSSSKSKGLRHSRNGTHIARSSSLLSLLSSKSDHSRASSEHDDTETENQMMNLKVENKSRARKDGIISSKDKDFVARKLKFRRGKVVELQSEVLTPRRLKFRRRLLVDNASGKVDTGRRSFGKKEGDDGEVGANRIQSILSKKVVLRHQHVEGKKYGKNLLNNVIEETASKLVETRKSKVKALVGAFETVISLQDSKPLVKISAY